MNESDDHSAIAAITACRARWIAAINAGDAEAFVAVLTDDAVWLPWGQAAISGKAAIRAWLGAPFAEYDYDYTVTDVQLRVAGAWAVERARFLTRATRREGGEAPTHEGRYTLLWRLTPAAGWLIERYIDHTGDVAPTT